ncbi:hypothetical protein LX99_00472 [Mucilaginibacter oryzae]|uniref:Uncharacterized protein n=1 Tax=Mucilaginibacter oryzae TaxID=468058 RepID=A0A316HJ07_9SPHI|nr:hypothetical protein [Mucilaginibacter oryzae]PWK80011.1 hypothetical protein LX99_00472 [Mucilaginibacter oryzae]
MADDLKTKKHILKPGLHQFVPGSAAVHCNENLGDEEAEWYIQRYPHIAALFISKVIEDMTIASPGAARPDSSNAKAGKNSKAGGSK